MNYFRLIAPFKSHVTQNKKCGNKCIKSNFHPKKFSISDYINKQKYLVKQFNSISVKDNKC